MDILIVLFFLGIAIGSFLNVVVLRHEKEKKITGRSVCMSCGKQLTWTELVPVFSYIFQRGKCRGCGVKLSIQYPLVEFFTGVLFVLVGYNFFAFTGVVFESLIVLLFIVHLSIWALFMVITVYDFRTKLIPDIFSYSLAGLAFVTIFIAESSLVLPTIWQVLAGPLLFLPFYILWKVSDGRWLGLGDGKLALGIGWLLGLSMGGTAILFSFWIGAGVAVLIIIWQKCVSRKRAKEQLTLKSEIPFGPFMVLATLIVYVFHINMYANILF